MDCVRPPKYLLATGPSRQAIAMKEQCKRSVVLGTVVLRNTRPGGKATSCTTSHAHAPPLHHQSHRGPSKKTHPSATPLPPNEPNPSPWRRPIQKAFTSKHQICSAWAGVFVASVRTSTQITLIGTPLAQRLQHPGWTLHGRREKRAVLTPAAAPDSVPVVPEYSHPDHGALR